MKNEDFDINDGEKAVDTNAKQASNNRLVWFVVIVMVVMCAAIGVISSVLTGYFMRRGSQPPVIQTTDERSLIEGVVAARKYNIVEVSCNNGSTLGSGIIMKYENSRYYIITNAHVAGADTTDVKVRFSGDDGYMTDARILGYSSYYDVSVITVAYSESRFDDLDRDDSDIFSRSTEYAEGECVVSIGNAMGMGIAAYDGIVSRASELLEYNGKTVPVLRTTAAINAGMSGGALFDTSGRFIGLTTYRMSNSAASGGDHTTDVEDTAFAVPVSVVYPIYKQILEFGDGGEIGLIDIDIRKTNKSAIGLIGLPMLGFSCVYQNGKLVVDTSNTSVLQSGDVITKIGSAEVTSDICRTTGEFLRYRLGSYTGELLRITAERNGAPVVASFDRYYGYVS